LPFRLPGNHVGRTLPQRLAKKPDGELPVRLAQRDPAQGELVQRHGQVAPLPFVLDVRRSPMEVQQRQGAPRLVGPPVRRRLPFLADDAMVRRGHVNNVRPRARQMAVDAAVFGTLLPPRFLRRAATTTLTMTVQTAAAVVFDAPLLRDRL